MLNDLISKVFGTQNSALAIKYKLPLYFIRLTIRLMNNENISMEEFESNPQWQFVLLTLVFNRYELAERATQNSPSMDLGGS